MKLTLVVPVYNEANLLESVIPHLYSIKLPMDSEWIFIDDKSTDRSLEILKRLQPQFGFQLITQETNQGKGAAVIRGIEAATGDFVMIQDADFEYHPKDIPHLLHPLIQDEADVVYGSRFKKSTPQVHRTYHYFVNRFLTMLSNLFSGLYLTDMETCYKIFKREIVQNMNLTSKRFGIEVEFTAYIAKIKARVYELPIHYFPRTVLQGKKINWKDGVAALRHLVHFNYFVSVEEAFKKSLPQKYR
jgi:glycosyltransferase involved in cell wall biosynthesis